MDGKKKLKIITPKELSSVSIKNVSSAMTFEKLQKMIEILTDRKLSLHYSNIEININETSLKLEDIFKDLNEIVLEIKVEEAMKFSSPALMNVIRSNSDNIIPSKCQLHPNEVTHYFCDNCNSSICFRCCLSLIHKQHSMKYKLRYFESKFAPVEKRFEKLTEVYNNKVIEGDEIRSKTLNWIENHFEALNLKLNEMRKHTLTFFDNFFQNLEFESNRLMYENERIEKMLKTVVDDFSLKNLDFNKNLDKIDATSKTLDLFNKHLKTIENYFSCKKDLVLSLESNINKIAVNIEKVRASLFDDTTLKFYEEVTGPARENKSVLLYMKQILDDIDKPPRYLSMPIPQTKKVLYYDFEKKNFEISLVPGSKFKFFDYCRFIDFNHFLIFNGGIENDADKNLSFIYNIKENKVFNMTEMVFPRAQHTLFYLPKYLIFSFGGYNNMTTEVYDMRLNTWFKFKDLSCYRSNANIILLNDYLFIFGGSDGEKYLSDRTDRIKITDILDLDKLATFEKNNFDNFPEKFEQIRFILKENISHNFQFSGSAICYFYQNYMQKVLVIGGYNAENDGFLTDLVKVGVYNEEEANIEFSNNPKLLVCKSCFYNQNLKKIDENVCGQFDARGNLILFDKFRSEFSLIKNTISF